ncbi:protein pelota 1 [Phtheirospermum japonicum]|uniref:Protein pelota 1 n=1 Tax=Phtheirospermum japonicum TaxID=374723 RepID=A0A830BX55_9LAMI|nr:protein pelota 1 [Phtheirospermum japonicum]
MKIMRRNLVRDGPGSVKIVPEEADDLWVAYNLIAEGDTVVASTVRKVLREAASGGRDAERVKLKLEIKVQELWDSLALDLIRQASDPKASADLAVVLMQEETSIPRKHGPSIAGYDKALSKFFDNVLQAFLKHVDFNVVRCAVIASPGFTKDQFHRHLLLEAERKQLRPVIENKHSLREVLDAPNVMNMIKDTQAAQEVRALEDFFAMLSNVRFYPSFMCSGYGFDSTLGNCWVVVRVALLAEARIRDLQAEAFNGSKDTGPFLQSEQQVEHLELDPERACYGPKHVEVAHERMAVQTLLITDELFRSADIPTRQKYVNLVDSVKASELTQLTGVAAILRFPLPDLEDIEM